MKQKYISSIKLLSPPPKESYLNAVPAIHSLSQMKQLDLSSDVTFLVGENGTGKSTLLEAIAVACGFNAEGGTKNFSFSTKSTHSDLYKHLSIARNAYPKDGFFLRAESFYNASSYLEDIYEPELKQGMATGYGDRSLHAQSHGESFLSLVLNRFGANGLYLLDEPEAALSPSRLMTLLARVHQLAKQNSQFVIATHSPILMTLPSAKIYQLDQHGIHSVRYQETEHYRLTRQFLENPDKMLHYLLDT